MASTAVDMVTDRISILPDEILLHILTFLPISHLFPTCALSKRWSYLWTSLHLHSVQFLYAILKFRLKPNNFDPDYLSRINRSIRSVLSGNIIELDLNISLEELEGEFNTRNDEKLCSQFLPCDSLEILKISSNFCLDLPISGCFRNLRIFHLEFLQSRMNQKSVDKLFPNLPLLEELWMKASLWISEEEITFNITTPALKIFSFSAQCIGTGYFNVKFMIVAPLLDKICLNEDQIASYSFKPLPKLSEAKLCVGKQMLVDNYMDRDLNAQLNIKKAMDLLWGVCFLKSLSLSSDIVLALVLSPQDQLLPVLPRLKKLELVIPYASAWNLLFPLLKKSPVLEILSVTFREYNNKTYDGHLSDQDSLLVELIGELQFVPPKFQLNCLILYLKEIEIRGVEKIEEFKVLEYIVKNANYLEKLTVHPVSAITI